MTDVGMIDMGGLSAFLGGDAVAEGAAWAVVAVGWIAAAAWAWAFARSAWRLAGMFRRRGFGRVWRRARREFSQARARRMAARARRRARAGLLLAGGAVSAGPGRRR